MNKAAMPPGRLSRVQATLVGGVFIVSAAAIAVVLTIGIGLWNRGTSLENVMEITGKVASESAATTDQYLRSVESATQQMEGWTTATTTDDALIDAALVSLVDAYDYLDGAYVGYPDGSFVYVHRSGLNQDTGYVHKRIGPDGSPTSETATLVSFDADLVTVSRHSAPDTFDPRTRPWYVAALSADSSAAWTEPYTFHSSGHIGVTRAEAVERNNEFHAVVGIDVRMDEITSFLNDRRPSPRSVVVVSDRTGQIIARSTVSENNDAVEQLVPEVLLAAAQTTESSLQPKLEVHSVEGVGTVVAAIVTESLGRDEQWQLVAISPEDDVVLGGRAAEVERAKILLAVGALGIAVLLVTLGATVTYVRKLHELATFDSLTGLLRRSSAMAALDRLVANLGPDEEASVMVLDLDGFKTINDSNGHGWGDRVLRQVAERMTSAANGEAIVGRLGGDEFIVFAAAPPGSPLFSQPSAILRSIERPLRVGEADAAISASAGVSSCTAERTKTSDQLLREADIALYDAKESRTGALVHFNGQMRLRSTRDAEQRQRFVRAMRRNLFHVWFQPEIELESGQVIGAEALLRLRDSNGSAYAEADDFVDDLERFGLLDQLLPTIVEQSAELAARYADRPFKMRINLATGQLANSRLEALLRNAISIAPSASFCLELSERTALNLCEQTVTTLCRLRSMGVSVALDDFGTGHASLTQLHRLPVDAIKIDRSFVDDLRTGQADQSMAAAIVDLGSMFDIEVVAEGIETNTQHRTLLDLGCRSGQGFLFGRAVSSESFIDRWPRVPAIAIS